MQLPIHFNPTPAFERKVLHIVLRALVLLHLILIINITCLDLTAFITRTSPIQTFTGLLTDNGKFVCGVGLALSFGPRIPWNCIDGFHAYSLQDGAQLVYTRDDFISPGETRQWVLGDMRQRVQQDDTGGNQMTVIKGRWFGCDLEDIFGVAGKRESLHGRRMKGRVESEDVAEDPSA